MPSKTDFNVSPYFDDFSESKKFHRVMYRPAFAVQARELTTQQSILQNQIEKLGDSLYRHGAMVIPGEATYDLNYYAVKLTSFTGTLTNFKDNTLTGGTSGVVADVVNTVATDGTDPDTLFVKYRNSGTDNVSNKFTDGETLTSGAFNRRDSSCKFMCYRFSCSYRSRYILHKWFFCRGRSTNFNTRQIYKHSRLSCGSNNNRIFYYINR